MINEYKNLPPTEYDNVIIFDLLSENERSTYNISANLEEFFLSNALPVVLVKKFCTAKDLKAEVQDLLVKAKSGKKFIFHFVAHGNEDCIGFKHTGEQVLWSELSEVLSEINEATENTLVLNMTTCFGLHAIKSVNFSKSGNPFFGLIGYSDELEITDSIKANQIFYRYIINGKQINEAITLLRNEMGNDKFHCITSQGYNNLK